MKYYYCVANNPDGLSIVPRARSRIQQGRYWVPDCVDYQSKFNLPRRIKAREVFAGWSCYNCKFLDEALTPRETPQKEEQAAEKAKA